MGERQVGSPLKHVIVIEVLDDILYSAMQKIAKLINGIHFHILIMPQTVQLGPIDVVGGVKIVLRYPLLLHCLPKTVIFDHILSQFLRML